MLGGGLGDGGGLQRLGGTSRHWVMRTREHDDLRHGSYPDLSNHLLAAAAPLRAQRRTHGRFDHLRLTRLTVEHGYAQPLDR